MLVTSPSMTTSGRRARTTRPRAASSAASIVANRARSSSVGTAMPPGEQDADLLEQLARRGHPVDDRLRRPVALAGCGPLLRARQKCAACVGVARFDDAAGEDVGAGERDVPMALEHQHRKPAPLLA